MNENLTTFRAGKVRKIEMTQRCPVGFYDKIKINCWESPTFR